MAQIGSVFPIEGGKRYKGTLTLKDEFGVQFRKHFTGLDPKKVRRKMQAYLEQYQAGMPTAVMTVTKCCELAIEIAKKKELQPKTVKGYEDFLKLHIKPIVGSVKVQELKAAHVERMMEKMAEKEIGAQTQILVRGFLRMALNRVALKNGYVQVNAAALADPPRLRRQTRRSLEPSDLDKILAAEKRPILRALWLFLASTGLRPAEARSLLWRDLVKADDGYWIKLRESKTAEGLQPVPVPNAVMDELYKLPKNGLYVFATKEGKPFDESNVRREWLKALEAAGVEFTNLYQLRKLFGTLKARKVSDSVLKRLMRHTDARTTKQYYVSAIESDLRSAVED